VPAHLSIVDQPTPDTARAVGVFADLLDDSGLDAALLRRLGFEGKADQVQLLTGGQDVVWAVGLGNADELTAAGYRRAAAAAVRAARKVPRVRLELLGSSTDAADAQAVAEGALLATYEFTAHKSSPTPPALATVEVVADGDAVRAALERGRIVADAVMRTRDLVNEPGGTMTPRALAKATRKLGRKTGFEVTVLNRGEIRELGLGGLLGVNRGSEEPPRFIELRLKPEGEATGSIALVGKGITFDTGGVSLKTATGMMAMKNDMAGAAAVIGAFVALAQLKPTMEVRGYIPATDNMTGGDATRPGDVLRIRNGKTIEVLNTDAEGRLVLADALSVAAEGRPDAIVDLATLTGACVTALGHRIAGLMSTSDTLVAQIEAASAASGEQVWHLPLPPEYRSQVDSPVADMKNIGNGSAGALVAGLILSEFVPEEIPWAHLDIAGPSFSDSDDAEVTKGATGYGVRLLVELVERFTRP
jgi:leucyl aminopeptidase